MECIAVKAIQCIYSTDWLFQVTIPVTLIAMFSCRNNPIWYWVLKIWAKIFSPEIWYIKWGRKPNFSSQKSKQIIFKSSMHMINQKNKIGLWLNHWVDLIRLCYASINNLFETIELTCNNIIFATDQLIKFI